MNKNLLKSGISLANAVLHDCGVAALAKSQRLTFEQQNYYQFVFGSQNWYVALRVRQSPTEGNHPVALAYHMTAGRIALSAALLVGSTPSTSTNNHNAGLTCIKRKSKPITK